MKKIQCSNTSIQQLKHCTHSLVIDRTHADHFHAFLLNLKICLSFFIYITLRSWKPLIRNCLLSMRMHSTKRRKVYRTRNFILIGFGTVLRNVMPLYITVYSRGQDLDLPRVSNELVLTVYHTPKPEVWKLKFSSVILLYRLPNIDRHRHRT